MVLVEAKEAAKMVEVVDAKLVDIASTREAEGPKSGQNQESRQTCGRMETRIRRSYINVDLMAFLLETGSRHVRGALGL